MRRHVYAVKTKDWPSVRIVRLRQQVLSDAGMRRVRRALVREYGDTYTNIRIQSITPLNQ